MKLPHHGSNHNVEREFFQRIQAEHYIISADGVKYHHPHEETLRWLVESHDPDEHFVVHLTNDIPFAVKALEKLHKGRTFDVVVRPKERVLVVELYATQDLSAAIRYVASRRTAAPCPAGSLSGRK